jgi:glycosyltransferase involved in cell wall biosynthesis
MCKGYQYQLKAIKQLRQSAIWPQLYFAWVGSGALEAQLRAAVAQLGVGKQVQFLGERADIPAILHMADVFVLPSEFEGMPLSLLEAMARGLPVLATAVSGIPEALGETGVLLTDPRQDAQCTSRELAATLQAWVLNPGLRQAIGQACHTRAVTMFRSERMLAEYLQVIHRVLTA